LNYNAKESQWMLTVTMCLKHNSIRRRICTLTVLLVMFNAVSLAVVLTVDVL